MGRLLSGVLNVYQHTSRGSRATPVLFAEPGCHSAGHGGLGCVAGCMLDLLIPNLLSLDLGLESNFE